MNEIRKIALHIIGMFLEQITKGNLEKSFELRNHLITGFTIDSFHQAQTIQIDSNKVYQLEEEFKQDYASKWISNKNFVYSLLQRHTHFSKTEIQALQEQYMVFMKAHAENGETSEPTAVRGVNKEQFMEIVNHVIKEDHEALDYVETLHCDQIFEVFDLDDTGYLDFK